MDRLVCPVLSLNTQTNDTLCIEQDCAFYVPQAKKCSIMMMGYQALLEAKKLQGAASK